MIVTISGYDGVGKTSSVDRLNKSICHKYGLSGTSIYEVNNNSEVYENIDHIDSIYDQLKEYDVIGTRFYMRSMRMQELQEQVMFAGVDVFKNTVLIKEVAVQAKKEAEIWYERVVRKLLKENKIIIYDRYWFDEVAYRSLYNLPPKYIEDLYKNYKEPDLKFFLYGDMELIKERNKDRIDMKTALFASDEKMSELFDNLEDMRKKYLMEVIDVRGKDRESVSRELLKRMELYFKENDVLYNLEKAKAKI